MSKELHIIQITDLHIPAPDEEAAGVDTLENFKRMLEQAAMLNPDLLVLSGDYCFKAPHLTIYEKIAVLLEKTRIPTLHLPGNHDDRQMMRQVFSNILGQGNEEIFGESLVNGHTVLFADTADAFMSTTQSTWWQKVVQHDHRIAFMHHPPVLMGVNMMDNKHAFQQTASMEALFCLRKQPLHIFCGHYHVATQRQVGQVHIHVTPSLLYQIDPTADVFKVGDTSIGFRQIWINDTSVKSVLHYFPSSKSS